MAHYPEAYFFYPPFNNISPFSPAATYRLGDSLDVSWTSNFPDGGTMIMLYCGQALNDIPRSLGGEYTQRCDSVHNIRGNLR